MMKVLIFGHLELEIRGNNNSLYFLQSQLKHGKTEEHTLDEELLLKTLPQR